MVCESMKSMPLSIQKQFLYTAGSGSFRQLNAILVQFAETDVRDYYGNTPLILAAGNGNARTVAALIAAGANIYASNVAGESALSMAAREAHPRVVKLLLEQGASFERRHGNRRALALLKPEENSVFRVRHLNAASDPTWEPWSSIKEPAKLRVQRIGRLLCKVVTLLIAYGADVNARGEEGNTPLHNFIEQDLDDCVRLLLKHSPDINAVSGYGDTPLARAIIWGKEELVLLLLKAGADPNAGRANSKPLLVAAGRDISPAVIMKLIETGADVTARNEEGESVLHKAMGRSRYGSAVTQMLLDAGADINALDANGFSVSDHALMAAINWHALAVPVRFKESVKPTEYPSIPFDWQYARFICAAINGDIDKLGSFHSDQIPSRIKALALHAAIYSGQADSCRWLLDIGVDPDSRDRFGHTPLIAATTKLDVAIVNLLLAYGASVDGADSRYTASPLCNTCQSWWDGKHPDDSSKQRLEMTKLLIEHGAEVNMRERDGYTPLRQAVIAVSDIELVRLLLEHGARTDIEDGDGLTALQLAEEHCSPEMVRLLKEYCKQNNR